MLNGEHPQAARQQSWTPQCLAAHLMCLTNGNEKWGEGEPSQGFPPELQL